MGSILQKKQNSNNSIIDYHRRTEARLQPKISKDIFFLLLPPPPSKFALLIERANKGNFSTPAPVNALQIFSAHPFCSWRKTIFTSIETQDFSSLVITRFNSMFLQQSFRLFHYYAPLLLSAKWDKYGL